MPTIIIKNGYRFFFFSKEGNEPMHIHIEKGEHEAKYWLEPISLASNHGFKSRELNEIKNIIIHNSFLIMERWNEYFK